MHINLFPNNLVHSLAVPRIRPHTMSRVPIHLPRKVVANPTSQEWLLLLRLTSTPHQPSSQDSQNVRINISTLPPYLFMHPCLVFRMSLHITHQRVSIVAKQSKALFSDRPTDIQNLTHIIKQDISDLNHQISQLQTYVQSTRQSAPSSSKGKAPVDEHNNNVLLMLQNKLAKTSVGFKDVLEIRTQVRRLASMENLELMQMQNMKASKERQEKFAMSAGSASTLPIIGSG